MEELKIKDLILRPTEETEEETQVSEKKKNKVCDYEIVICSGCDFAIRRKTPKSSKLIVFLPSQDQYYIKDEKNDTIISLKNSENTNAATDYATFCSDFDEKLDLPNCNWLDHLFKGKTGYDIIFEKLNNDAVRQMIVDGVGKFLKSTIYTSYTTDLIYLYKYLGSKLFKYCCNKIEDLNINSNLKGLIGFAHINNMFGPDVAKRFLDQYLESNLLELGKLLHVYINFVELSKFYDIESINHDMAANGLISRTVYHPSYGIENVNKTKFDADRFIEYILYSSVRQGYTSLSDFLDDWYDDLDMQYYLYNKIKDKYPENLKTHHDQLSFKVRLSRMRIDAERFDNVVLKMAQYEKMVDEYNFIAPKTPQDMIDESVMQQNCLALYVDRVTNSECMIFFMRHKDTITESYITIEVRHDHVVQVKRRNNAWPTEKDLDIINKWCKSVDLTLDLLPHC